MKALKEQRYVAPLIKRVWIDKDGGKKRPIGLLEIEDKIVQKAVSILMGAVYEQDFHPFSYGFREERNAHQALGEIREQCMKHGIRWIYDADITGFFDNIDRSWLRTFIQQRINDGGLLRLIGKWLNAGVMEGDQITYSDRSTPQGGTISPCLASVFLHHVLDEWFVRDVKPRLRGHFQYFGVRCNMRSMEAVLHHAKRGWKFWLDRRSSKKALNLGEVRGIAGEHAVADTQDHPQCLTACGVA
ncbi:MAG: hypothetical protein GY703_03465 [Gammaproteobacteria bacterium]|nr:hypothetical protein [Gammaproteobacteria bacterium]